MLIPNAKTTRPAPCRCAKSAAGRVATMSGVRLASGLLRLPAVRPDAGGRVAAGGPEPAVAARRPRQRVHLVEPRLLDPLDHELRDPVAAPEADRPRAVGVERRDLDLTPVARVDRARGVHDRDAVPGRQARAGM